MNTDYPYSEEKLLQQVAQSDARAFEQLFHLYKQRVYQVALQMVKLAQPAEEVVQEVFISLWHHRQELGGIQSVTAYLFRITRNKAIDQLRKQTADARMKQAMWLEISEKEMVFPEPPAAELQQLINEVIDTLPPKRKEIFLLSRNHDLTYKEIADKTNTSINTVKTHLLLAVREIKAYLGRHNYTCPILIAITLAA
ncbi:RNA polymerase sigma-70 factor, ECF subfamily [Filimonas lacunae]|uniref:RNA polymerase sigma-70 factor, ECF subfamily n=1 Tax=Filimonas lacunae TaxID=477680 RepID=A0A173MFC6_9BACT|nr:RNA polymerase sigma-70 factor [Filimonas lacunae]BAV06275.1 RNA polymerase ECF-type sigma factor [Filimonas lacunae]SIT25600.1 RNA polymerase sigma-70 factor, ECF subfamily [Filimonas lacunae]